MTRKELNLAIFEGKADKVLWQPRLEEWIRYNRERNTIPQRFKNMDNFGIYDELGCSVRYAASAGIVEYNKPDDVQCRNEQVDENHYATFIKIPEGELRIVHHTIKENGRIANDRIEEFPVKTPEGLKVLTFLVNRKHYRADIEVFNAAANRVGHRAEPTVFLSSSGFTDLIKHWTGLLDAFYLLHDYRENFEEYLEACDRRDDRLIDTALQLPCRIFNLGDHTTNEFTPPPILERYIMPRWQKIGKRMTKEDRFVHTHWDGHSKLLLPYAQKIGLHGIEALTPKPMGDMTLEEIKEAVRDNIVVLDLVPTIHFLPSYSTEEVLDFTKKVIDMFAPRLILGVSDEISGVGQIEKIEAISKLVDDICGLAD